MAEKAKVSAKHLQINKSQSTMLAVVALAVAFSVFGLFATKALITKGLYQRRALSARRDVVSTLKDNYTAAKQLADRYNSFASQDPNIIGGSGDPNGNGPSDGDNPRIVLDALPSNYDAPALASSIEKIMNGRGVKFDTLSVTDDPATNSDAPQSQPKSIAMPFSFEGTTNYKSAMLLLQDFERSIRPFDLNTLEIDGSDKAMKLTIDMTTYFQPPKSLDLSATKEVK